MTDQERVEQLQHAKELVHEAMSIVDYQVSNTSEQSHYEAYGKYGFNQLMGEGNPHDHGIDHLIRAFGGDPDEMFIPRRNRKTTRKISET